MTSTSTSASISTSAPSPILYRPPESHLHSEPTTAFRRHLQNSHAINFEDDHSYQRFWEWSTRPENLSAFWTGVWDYTGVLGSRHPAPSSGLKDHHASPADNPLWFEGATANWAENALKRCKDYEKVALVQATEPYPANSNPPHRSITYRDLYLDTLRVASALRALGIEPGDRVASYSNNSIENVVAFLATAAIGGIWTSAAADFASSGVLERFVQVEPKVVFVVDAVSYNGKIHPHSQKVEQLLDGLHKAGKSPLALVTVPFATEPKEEEGEGGGGGVRRLSWSALLSLGEERKTGWLPAEGGMPQFEWYPTPFNHPLWILFSSGTTGSPKAIVHRSGGMLLQALKELRICAGMREDDVFFYYTTTGWMMWNFLIGGLLLGSTLVLYDGSPLKEPSLLWRLVDELGITIFGTSAKYLEELAKKYTPNRHHSLKTLRQLHSTGSPLAPSGFDYVYSSIVPLNGGSETGQQQQQPNSTLLLASITGGTDICSLFAGFNSTLPVIRGEIQCRMLGMAIAAAASEDQQSSTSSSGEAAPGEQGELVCLAPFPCQPLGFWPLEGFGTEEAVRKAKDRFRDAYFAGGRKGVWYHGDHVVVMPSRDGNAGGVIMLGRSDGVLNPGGIRFGSAEIYEVLSHCFSESSPGLARDHVVLDALCIGQKIGVEKADERVLLFVRLHEGVTLGEDLVSAIAKEVRSRRSARHVPARCIQVDDVPYTLNGKKVEVPVRKIINGAPLSSINLATLRNPECLEQYVELATRLGAEAARL